MKILKKIVGPPKYSDEYITFSTKLKKFFSSIHLDAKHLLAGWMGCLTLQDIGNYLMRKFLQMIFMTT
jgi:hypothetical protein